MVTADEIVKILLCIFLPVSRNAMWPTFAGLQIGVRCPGKATVVVYAHRFAKIRRIKVANAQRVSECSLPCAHTWIVSTALCQLATPLAIFWHGRVIDVHLIINILLCIFTLWIGGIIHAFWYCFFR